MRYFYVETPLANHLFERCEKTQNFRLGMTRKSTCAVVVKRLNSFRAVKVALSFEQSLFQISIAFNRDRQIVLDYGSAHKACNKSILSRATYQHVRREAPNLSSALVQRARDEAPEMLKRNRFAVSKKKENGKRSNRKLGSWSYVKPQKFVAYKAEGVGKATVFVEPEYTSQRCSRCGFMHKQNGHGLNFYRGNCGFRLNASLSAAKNIGMPGKPEPPSSLSTSQSRHHMNLFVPTGTADGVCKPLPLGRRS